MAAAKGISYGSIMQDLKSGQYAPVYYLYGDEPYYIDRITDFIENNALEEESRDFNQVVLYGLDTTMMQVIDNARAYPMMAQRRVVIVKESAPLFRTESMTGILENYLQNPSEQTVLVFTNKHGKIDRRTRISAMLEKTGVVFESAPVKEEKIPDFVKEYVNAQGKDIDNKSCSLMVEAIGADLCRITNELDKLIIVCKDDPAITPQIIEEHIGISKDFNIWEFRKALAEKDVLKANRIAVYFDGNKDYPIQKITSMLFPFFQNLLISYWAPQKTDRGLMSFLKVNYYEAVDCLSALKRFTASKVIAIISKIRQTDAASKGFETTGAGANGLLTELVYFILN